MVQLQISEDIRPISELKSKGSEIVTQVIEKHRPVVLTRHGRGVAVMLSVNDYESLFQAAQRGALVEALREGERDFTAGRVLTHDEMRARWLSEDPEDG